MKIHEDSVWRIPILNPFHDFHAHLEAEIAKAVSEAQLFDEDRNGHFMQKPCNRIASAPIIIRS